VRLLAHHGLRRLALRSRLPRVLPWSVPLLAYGVRDPNRRRTPHVYRASCVDVGTGVAGDLGYAVGALLLGGLTDSTGDLWVAPLLAASALGLAACTFAYVFRSEGALLLHADAASNEAACSGPGPDSSALELTRTGHRVAPSPRACEDAPPNHNATAAHRTGSRDVPAEPAAVGGVRAYSQLEEPPSTREAV
jgi:hypothetical protein